MSYFMIDLETDGVYAGDYSILQIGCVIVEPGLKRTFFSNVRPITENHTAEAMAVNKISLTEAMEFPHPSKVIPEFRHWILENNTDYKPVFVADNAGFDWQFMNYYFWKFCGENPFSFWQVHLGSLYKGMVKDMTKSFKHLRRTEHTHNALDDAMGNAEAMLHLIEHEGLKAGK